MTEEESNRRKFVYRQARAALRRKGAGAGRVNFALRLLDTVDGYKALGLKLRLQRKIEGKPFDREAF